MKPEDAFDQYHQAVYSFAYRFTGRGDLAEDITQDCFVALLRAPARFDPERGTLKTFLFAIARNLALKHFRDQDREQPMPDDDVPSGLDYSDRIDLSSAVAAAVGDLPPLQREALVLFEYEGATLEEIALIVGADVGTVKSRLYRARERLRRSLATWRTNHETV